MPLEQMIEQLGRLPGVGRKTAAKYAFRLLDMTTEELEEFTAAILDGKRRIRECQRCFNLCEGMYCTICNDESRTAGQVCVVEDARTLMAMERVRTYKGRYHVLGGVLSPIDGVGPEQLHIRDLLERIQKEEITEVIIATNPTVEGETTAMYLTKLLRPMGVKCTRLAYGVPVGADLEYADEITLARALDGRREL